MGSQWVRDGKCFILDRQGLSLSFWESAAMQGTGLRRVKDCSRVDSCVRPVKIYLTPTAKPGIVLRAGEQQQVKHSFCHHWKNHSQQINVYCNIRQYQVPHERKDRRINESWLDNRLLQKVFSKITESISWLWQGARNAVATQPSHPPSPWRDKAQFETQLN